MIFLPDPFSFSRGLTYSVLMDPDCYDVFILICLGFADSVLGEMTVKTPSTQRASTLAVSTWTEARLWAKAKGVIM